MSKSAKDVIRICCAILVMLGVAALLISRLLDSQSIKIYYTQVDNSRIKENHPTGGVVDPTGGLAYSYTLPSYDEEGAEKDIEFGMSRQLREDAFLRLEVMPIRGVMNWSEVRYDELPEAVQGRYEAP